MQAAELRASGIRHLSLFGSVARDADADSDIELAAELDPNAHIGLFGISAIELQLGEILGRKVFLPSEPVGKQGLRANIARDRRRVFLARHSNERTISCLVMPAKAGIQGHQGG